MSGGAVTSAFSQFAWSRRLPSRVAEGAIATALSFVLGVAIAMDARLTLLGLAAAAVGLATLRYPMLPLAMVVVVASVSGRDGAHLLVPGAGLPVLETLLALGAGVAFGWLLSPEARRMRLDPFAHVGPWLPAAGWGIALVLLHASGDPISRLRDAMIFIYPVLIALALATASDWQLRRGSERWAATVVLLAAAVALIGVYNQLTGRTTVTSSGQLRALASSFAPPLFAALILSLWLRRRRWGDGLALLGSAPVVGLLLVNHRSAYLALIVAFTAFLIIERTQNGPAGPKLARLLVPASVCLVIILVVTPAGRAGVARFASITNRSDPNVVDRLQLSRSATELTGTEWLVGKSLGTSATSFADEQPDETHYGVHNSYLSALRSGGLIGAIVLFGPVMLVVLRMLRRRRDPYVQPLLALSLFAMVMTGFNVVLENGYFSVWFWVPLILGGRMVAPSHDASVTMDDGRSPAGLQTSTHGA